MSAARQKGGSMKTIFALLIIMLFPPILVLILINTILDSIIDFYRNLGNAFLESNERQEK